MADNQEPEKKETAYECTDTRTVDVAEAFCLAIADEKNISTAYSRFASQGKQCSFGLQGLCCRNCSMGPCRIQPGKPGKDRGVCGATGATIAARNFARMTAGGAAAHSDHGRDVAHVFLETAHGQMPGYEIKDEVKLRSVCEYLGIKLDDEEGNPRDKMDLAKELGELSLAQFGKQDESPIAFLKRAPKKRQQFWHEKGIEPRGIDREIVEIMHRTHVGVDQEYSNIMKQASRAAIGDGWGGSMIATELQDIMFGTPFQLKSKVNLGVLKDDQVNLVVHGHEPILSEMVVMASQDPEMIALAKSKGAKGINISGICCTANELLMRHGIPIAGNYLHQELAITTGAVDAMVVDVQCIFASLVDVSKSFHTKIITTSPKGKQPGAIHMQFEENRAMEIAKEIVTAAIENYPNRGETRIPQENVDLVAGFSHESIRYMLGGSFRASYTPLNDNIINGRIRGVAGVVGCNNPKVRHDFVHNEVVKKLIANDILVVQTGCSAIACAKEGLMTPEAAKKFAGPGLAEVCETVGLPPVLHAGSCVDNSRILIALAEMVETGGLGDDICDLPVAGSAPEWMSEKAISIGHYFVASGVYTVFGATFPFLGTEEFKEYLFKGLEEDLGATWDFAVDADEHAQKMIDHIDKKRKALGIDKARERVLFDMDARRQLEV